MNRKKRTPKTPEPQRVPLTAPVMQYIYPAVQEAVTRALHPEGDLELQKVIDESMERVRASTEPSPALANWLDANDLVADEGPVPEDDADAALQEAIEKTAAEHAKFEERLNRKREELGLAEPEALSFEGMTAKELRPLASAAGMKGARTAKKADMIEHLRAARDL